MIYFFILANRFIKLSFNKHCPGKAVHIHVIAARLRMDMKVACGEVKDELKKFHPVGKK